jgi:hypothetical protein
MTVLGKWVGGLAMLLCMGSPVLANDLTDAEAQAVIGNKFEIFDPTCVMLWKSLDIGAAEIPTMFDKVQLHIPANTEVFMVRAAFTTKWGTAPRYQGRDYVSYYRFYDDDNGNWQAEQTAADDTSESDPYYMQ